MDLPPLRVETEDGIKEFFNYPLVAELYAKEASAAGANVCKWIKLQTARYLRMLEMAKNPRNPFYYSPAHVVDYLSFIEKIRHFEDGNWLVTQMDEDGSVDDSYYLEPWQIWEESAIQGFRKKPTGHRLVNRAITLVPRKNDKSGKLARGLLYELCCAGGRATEILVSAASAEQAKKTLYKDIELILDVEPELRDQYGIKFTKDDGISSGKGTIYPITSRAKKLDGYNPSLAIFEEGAAGDADVFKVVTSAFASKPNSQMRMITTAGQYTAGPAWELMLEAQRLLTGKQKDDVFSFFSAFYTLDDDDYRNPESRAIDYDRLFTDDSLLEKANPMYGVSLDPEKVKEDRENARRRPDLRGEFVRTRFNIWTGSGVGLIENAAWAACARDIRIEQFVGLPCWVGGDLAQYNDMCAIVVLFEAPGDTIVAFPKFYLPEESPLARDPDRGDTIHAWAEAGHLTLTPGPAHDHDLYGDDLEAYAEVLKPRFITCDPHQAHAIVNRLWGLNINIGVYPNNGRTMTAPTDDLLRRIAIQKFWHDGNPVFAWHAQNVHGEKRPNGSIVPRKESPNSMNKIDGIVAAVMANGVRMHPDYATDVKRDDPYVSPYETGRVIGVDS